MSERPILFNGEMVRALLAGRKTQTRRPVIVSSRDTFAGAIDYERGEWCWQNRDDIKRVLVERCPLGQPGDRLWVRETWCLAGPNTWAGLDRRVCGARSEKWHPEDTAFYAAGFDRAPPSRWRPSIHMPRWASRITLEITDVRVQRVQEITDAEAVAEGVLAQCSGTDAADGRRCCFGTGHAGPCRGPILPVGVAIPEYHPSEVFSGIWERIYGAESWTSNAWVWAVTFRRVEGVREYAEEHQRASAASALGRSTMCECPLCLKSARILEVKP